MMLENLFTSNDDFNTLCNLKAKSRILSKTKEIGQFEEEIDEAIKKCTEIFDNNNSEINYVTELLDLESKFQNLENQKYNSNEIDALASRREDLYEKYNRFVNTLPLNVKEDLEFYSKKVLDREKRLNDANSIIDSLRRNYPEAENINVEEAFEKTSLLKDIKEYLHPTSNEVEENTVSLPYVEKITKASDDLVNNEDELQIADPNSLTEEIPAEPAEPETSNYDNSFFDHTDAFSGLLENSENLSSLFTEQAEEEKPEENFKLPEEEITPFSFEEPTIKPINIENESQELITEEKVSEDKPLEQVEIEEPSVDDTPVPETTTEPNSSNLEYTLDNGLSLSMLAEAACGNANGWKDIYETNKEVIDERLNLNGLTIEEAKDNDIALTGLKLIIPNVYNNIN